MRTQALHHTNGGFMEEEQDNGGLREEEQDIENPTPDLASIPGLLAFVNKDDKVMSREFAYRAAQRGLFPSYKIGKKIFVRIPEVLAALRQG